MREKSRKEEHKMLSEEMIRDLVNGLQLIFAKNVTQIILYGSVKNHLNIDAPKLNYIHFFQQ